MAQIQIVRYASANDFGFAELKETKAPQVISGEILQSLIGGRTIGRSLQWGTDSGKVIGMRLPFADQSSVVFLVDWASASIGASLNGPRIAFLPRPF